MVFANFYTLSKVNHAEQLKGLEITDLCGGRHGRYKRFYNQEQVSDIKRHWLCSTVEKGV